MRWMLTLVLVLAGLVFDGCSGSDKSTDIEVPQAKNHEEQLAATQSRTEEQGTDRRRRRRQLTDEERAQRVERRTEDLAKSLKLSDEQREQVKVALVEMYERMSETFARMREEGGSDREKRREAMLKIRAQHEDAMRKILSDEQFQEYQKLRERRRPRRSRRSSEDRPGEGR